jgi:hypothetical protein
VLTSHPQRTVSEPSDPAASVDGSAVPEQEQKQEQEQEMGQVENRSFEKDSGGAFPARLL